MLFIFTMTKPASAQEKERELAGCWYEFKGDTDQFPRIELQLSFNGSEFVGYEAWHFKSAADESPTVCEFSGGFTFSLTFAKIEFKFSKRFETFANVARLRAW